MLLNISEVAEEIKLSKIDDKPWGFRLTGGLDFGTPVTVIKVTAGSLAEQAGLKVGDILLEANGKPLSYLTHHESQQLLLEAGNFIELLVVRGSLVLAPPTVPKEATEGDEVSQQGEAINQQGESQTSSSTRLQKQAPRELSLFESIFGPLDEQIEETFIENVIQEVLTDQQLESGVDEPHLTQELVEPQGSGIDVVENTEHTVMSQEPETDVEITPELQEVNEQQTEMFTEEVKRELTEEDIVDIMTGHAEVLQGTSIGVDFDKLDPKSEIIDKSEVLQALKEEENELEKKKLTTFLQVPNRPKIKPKEKPKQQPQKHTQDSSEVEGTKKEEETDEPKVEEDIQLNEKKEQDRNKAEEQEMNMSEEQDRNKAEEQEMKMSEEQEINIPEEQGKEEKRSENVEDLRLLEIQNQLSALLQLPTVMQEQLAVLQQQVANIVQQKLAALHSAASQENMPTSEEEPSQKETEVSDERNEEADEEGKKLEDISQTVEGEESVQKGEKSVQEGEESVQEGESVQEDEKSTAETGNQENVQSQQQENSTTNTAEEDPSEGRKRDIKREKPKRNKPFFPLTPHPRPIILPGKIKFQMNPEEVYDDDFIAETMSGNAEVIIGNAIGVNFQKYQRNYDHLKSSSVYHMIHETEERSPGAFRGRPEKLPANEDYKPAAEVREQQDA
ncbi:high mobility group nucleosome-binding domain-containing protein 5-like isoform X2 [Periplaneta americana]|uniref:high mobility group nucleosome-binding domain-containing protein 5-like isoform X2 n=1 Tax=Periplaneta americana TaxID=6978 RepID=UPI0037E84F0C